MNTARLLVALAAVTAIVLVGGSGPAIDPAAVANGPFAGSTDATSADAAVRLYANALSAITRNAVFASTDRERVVAQTLNAYLAAQDPYSGFMTRSEYMKYRALRDGPYGGVGMDLERRRDGETLCYPYAGGPAEQAGIKAGDRLISIDGTQVAGKPLPVLAALATGGEGTQVVLEVAGGDGRVRRVSVRRARITSAQTSEFTAGTLHGIRLASFTPNTQTEVELAIRRWDRNLPIVIDLRGCGGGDFYAAVDTAMLFLKQGSLIVAVSGRDGTRRYANTMVRPPLPQPIFLWQDQHTASAAEVFIGALTDNRRAVSIGTRSAGKASRQDIVELADGSALVLTTGYLSTPDGFSFNERGLLPMRPLANDADTAAYVRATGQKE